MECVDRPTRLVDGDHPAEGHAALLQPLDEVLVRDRADRTGQAQTMRELVGDVARVGVDRDRAEPRAREPAEEERGRVLEQQHHRVARAHATGDEARRDPVDLRGELRVRPGDRLAVAVLPHQERVGAAAFDALRERSATSIPVNGWTAGRVIDVSIVMPGSARRRASGSGR